MFPPAIELLNTKFMQVFLSSSSVFKISMTFLSPWSSLFISLVITRQVSSDIYNKNLRFIDYTVGQKVWVKVKHYKTGENRKLAPRRDGPWTIVDKLPNGVNFRVENSRKQQKTVHHDRLSPFIAGSAPSEIGDNNIDNNQSSQHESASELESSDRSDSSYSASEDS